MDTKHYRGLLEGVLVLDIENRLKQPQDLSLCFFCFDQKHIKNTHTDVLRDAEGAAPADLAPPVGVLQVLLLCDQPPPHPQLTTPPATKIKRPVWNQPFLGD